VFTGTGGTSFGATGTTKYVACGDGPAGPVANPAACNPAPATNSGNLPGTGQTGVSANGFGNNGLNGQTTFTYYAIPTASYTTINSNGTSTSATTCSTTGWTKLTSGTAGDLADSPNNTAYVVRLFETDKLGNARCTDLAAAQNTINSGAFARGTIGVDKVAPTMVQLDPGNAACPVGGCVSNLQKVNIAFLADPAQAGVVPSFAVSYQDFPAQSGFSTVPVTTMFTRLAIDPATNAPSTTSTAFGCPIGFSTQDNTCSLANGVQAGGTIKADANSASGASAVPPIDGYYSYTGRIIDLARNTGNTVTRQVVVDRAAPTMGGTAVPATINGGQTASFPTSATDNLDLVSADYTLSYAALPSGGVPLNIRSQQQTIQNSVAFDNTLITAASFNLVVPFFIRTVSTTTALNAPQFNPAPAASIGVRAYDGADNPSAANTSPIGSANLPQNNLTQYNVPQASGATFNTFQESNAVANISNCPAAGCTGGVAPANATTVTLTATAVGSESAGTPAFQFANPFTAVQFYYIDAGYAGASGEYILIGSVPAPSVTDNAAQTLRTFTWTLTTPFDPPAVLPPGALRIIALGVNAIGDGLASAVNTAITLTNP
jgi:hypothetical protein